MTIKVTYNVTDVYVSETISATYINISYDAPNSGGGEWGSITGTLSNQTDLQNALNGKFDDPTGTTSQYIRGDGTLATFPTIGGATWGSITGTLSNQTDLQNALNGKVPYSGAVNNVNLGEYEIKAGQFTLDTTPTGTAAVGTTRWNDAIGSTETTLKGGNVILKNGFDLVVRVVNKVTPNTTLTKAEYQAVRVTGAQGQRLAVAYAQANNDNNSADTIGLVTETIATNQEGFIVTVGQIEGINTTGSLQGETWVDGDVLYLSPTIPGALTKVKPVAPQHLVIIGYVEYAHQNNGKIYVKVMNGYELGELHDCNTTGATNGQVLKYNGSIWTPQNDNGITSLNTLTALSQTFATGSAGTDFGINSTSSTHTFNLPTASATNRGLLSSADWSNFNNKIVNIDHLFIRQTGICYDGFANPVDFLTYNNGSSGVGATLRATNALPLDQQYFFIVNGATAIQVNLNDRILIINRTNSFENGLYYFSAVEQGQYNGTPVLTRMTAYDQPSDFTNNVFVQITKKLFPESANLFVGSITNVTTIGSSEILFMPVDGGRKFGTVANLPARPFIGQQYYQTDGTSGQYVFDGSNWNRIVIKQPIANYYVQHLTTTAYADATTYYFGAVPNAATASQGLLRGIFNEPGTIRSVYLFFRSITSPSNESIPISLWRATGGGTMSQIASTTFSWPGGTSFTTLQWTGLNIAVSPNQTYEFKIDVPNMAINPSSVLMSGNIEVELT